MRNRDSVGSSEDAQRPRPGGVGAHAVTLEVRISNIPAREFYGSYGFREAYRRKAYYQDGEDAFAMVLPLGDVKR